MALTFKLLVITLLATALVVTVVSARPALAEKVQGISHAKTVNIESILYLRDYLTRVGAKLNCYFTLELDSRLTPFLFGDNTNRKSSPLFDPSVKEDPSVHTVGELIKKLKQDFPADLIVQSKENPNIIHLIDSSLLADADYAMQKQTSVTYSGLLYEFPTAIGSRVAGVTAQQWFVSPGPSNDWTTTVDIHDSHGTVRELLTQNVPLANYKHIIWVAETIPKPGKIETQVQFYGPMTKAVVNP